MKEKAILGILAVAVLFLFFLPFCFHAIKAEWEAVAERMF